VLLQLVLDGADTSTMFGLGSRSGSVHRARFVNWRAVGLYGLALFVTIVAGWAISRVG
jgi:hypothetical protein